MPARLRRAVEGAAHPRRPLPRHAGHRVHRRARQALDAADPHRQAHGAGGAENRRVDLSRRAASAATRRSGASNRSRSTSYCTRCSTRARRRPCWRAVCRPRPGAASGKIVFSADEAEAAASRGERVILVRTETSPEDIHGMHAAKGILTVRGGMTSHAAVVARGMGRPCVCRRRRSAHRLRGQHARGTQPYRARRRHDHDQRLDRRGHPWRSADDRAAIIGRFRDTDGLGRRSPHASGSAPMPRPRSMPALRAGSAPRESACRAPSTCSSRPTASARCAR